MRVGAQWWQRNGAVAPWLAIERLVSGGGPRAALELLLFCCGFCTIFAFLLSLFVVLFCPPRPGQCCADREPATTALDDNASKYWGVLFPARVVVASNVALQAKWGSFPAYTRCRTDAGSGGARAPTVAEAHDTTNGATPPTTSQIGSALTARTQWRPWK